MVHGEGSQRRQKRQIFIYFVGIHPKELRETTNVLVPITNYRRIVNRLRRGCEWGALSRGA